MNKHSLWIQISQLCSNALANIMRHFTGLCQNFTSSVRNLTALLNTAFHWLVSGFTSLTALVFGAQ